MLRTFQVVLLAIFAAIAVVGLIAFATYNAGSRGESGIGEVVMWGVLPEKIVEEAFLDLKSEYPVFQNVKYVYKAPDRFTEEFTEALALGTGPDILFVSHEFIVDNEQKIRLISGGSTQPRGFRDAYLEVAEPMLVEGGSLMLPITVDPLILYYNRDILNAAGVTRAPATWEEVASLTPRLTKRPTGADITLSTVPFGVYQNVPHARLILSALFMQSGSRIVKREGDALTVTLYDQKSSSALRFFSEFANPLTDAYTWNGSLPSAFTQFVSGDLALYPAPFSEREVILDGAPNVNTDARELPKPELASSSITSATLYGMVLPRSSKNAQDAVTVLPFFKEEAVVRTLADALSMAPALRSLITPNAGDAFVAVGHKAALLSRVWLSPEGDVVDGIFKEMVDNVRSGLLPPDQALREAQDALQREVQ